MVELWEIFVQIGFPFGGDCGLIRRFAVSAIEFLHNVHPSCHLAKCGKSHRIQARVVTQVDKKLGGARVGAGRGEE